MQISKAWTLKHMYNQIRFVYNIMIMSLRKMAEKGILKTKVKWTKSVKYEI